MDILEHQESSMSSKLRSIILCACFVEGSWGILCLNTAGCDECSVACIRLLDPSLTCMLVVCSS